MGHGPHPWGGGTVRGAQVRHDYALYPMRRAMSGSPVGAILHRAPGMRHHVHCPGRCPLCSVSWRYHRATCSQDECEWFPEGARTRAIPKGSATTCISQGGILTCVAPRSAPMSAATRKVLSQSPIIQAPPGQLLTALLRVGSHTPWTRPQHSAKGRIQGRLCRLHGTSSGSGRGSLLSPLHRTLLSGSMPFTQRKGRGSLGAVRVCVSVCLRVCGSVCECV